MKKILSVTYVLIASFMAACLIVVSCTAIPGSITSATHPNSKIVSMLEAVGLDPEATGKTIADIVIMEIAVDKFEKAEVLKFIDKKIDLVQNGIYYDVLAKAIEEYGNLIVLQNESQTDTSSEAISQAALIGYILMRNRFNYNALQIDAPVNIEDKEIVLKLLRHVKSQVKLLS